MQITLSGNKIMNAKRKGNKGENKFANWMQSHGFKVYKNASSGGNAWKSDVHNDLDANFEVKTVKRINLQEAWKQTTRDASLARNQPYLVIHFDGMHENSWLIVMHSEDWVEMLKNSRGVREVVEIPQEDSRDKRYKIERAVAALKELLKEYSNL